MEETGAGFIASGCDLGPFCSPRARRRRHATLRTDVTAAIRPGVGARQRSDQILDMRVRRVRKYRLGPRTQQSPRVTNRVCPDGVSDPPSPPARTRIPARRSPARSADMAARARLGGRARPGTRDAF